jgi:hypothetical protein
VTVLTVPSTTSPAFVPVSVVTSETLGSASVIGAIGTEVVPLLVLPLVGRDGSLVPGRLGVVTGAVDVDGAERVVPPPEPPEPPADVPEDTGVTVVLVTDPPLRRLEPARRVLVRVDLVAIRRDVAGAVALVDVSCEPAVW